MVVRHGQLSAVVGDLTVGTKSCRIAHFNRLLLFLEFWLTVHTYILVLSHDIKLENSCSGVWAEHTNCSFNFLTERLNNLQKETCWKYFGNILNNNIHMQTKLTQFHLRMMCILLKATRKLTATELKTSHKQVARYIVLLPLVLVVELPLNDAGLCYIVPKEITNKWWLVLILQLKSMTRF